MSWPLCQQHLGVSVAPASVLTILSDRRAAVAGALIGHLFHLMSQAEPAARGLEQPINWLASYVRPESEFYCYCFRAAGQTRIQESEGANTNQRGCSSTAIYSQSTSSSCAGQYYIACRPVAFVCLPTRCCSMTINKKAIWHRGAHLPITLKLLL